MGQAKNFLNSYSILNNVLMTGNQTSGAVQVPYLDNIGLQAVWTGTTPVGALVVECTEDDTTNTLITSTWTALDFGSAISVSGNSGNHIINMNQLPYKAVRVRYVFTSGTGNITVKITAKML